MEHFAVVSTLSQLDPIDETSGVPERMITVTIQSPRGLFKTAPVVVASPPVSESANPPPKLRTPASVATQPRLASASTNPRLKPRPGASIATERESASGAPNPAPKQLALSAVLADEYTPDQPAAVVREEEEEEEEADFDSPLRPPPDSPDPGRDDADSPAVPTPSAVLQTMSTVQVDVPPAAKRSQRPREAANAAHRPSTTVSHIPDSAPPAPEPLCLLYLPTAGVMKYRSQKPISVSLETEKPPRKASQRRIPTVNDELPVFHSEDGQDFTKARRFRSRVGPGDITSMGNLSPIPKRKAGATDATAYAGLAEYLAEGGGRKRRTIAAKGEQMDTVEFLRVEREKARKKSVWMFVPLDGTDTEAVQA